MDAATILADARARAAAREAVEATRPRPDYGAMNVKFRAQKAALTRAQNTGDRDKIVEAVARAVREWGQAPFNGMWPDDWSRWQRALDDALPWNEHIDLDDLR